MSAGGEGSLFVHYRRNSTSALLVPPLGYALFLPPENRLSKSKIIFRRFGSKTSRFCAIFVILSDDHPSLQNRGSALRQTRVFSILLLRASINRMPETFSFLLHLQQCAKPAVMNDRIAISLLNRIGGHLVIPGWSVGLPAAHLWMRFRTLQPAGEGTRCLVPRRR